MQYISRAIMNESDDPGHKLQALPRVKLPSQGKIGSCLFNLVELPKETHDVIEEPLTRSPLPDIFPPYLYNLHKTLRTYDCRLRYP